jgi:hypothetical protein
MLQIIWIHGWGKNKHGISSVWGTLSKHLQANMPGLSITSWLQLYKLCPKIEEIPKLGHNL